MRILLPVLLALGLPLGAQGSSEQPQKPETAAKEDAQPLPAPVVTHHQISAGSRVLKYTATVGFMPLVDEQGKREARVFYTAYTLDGGGANRPLLFAFNGGPGSASIWLHLGCIGPRRVALLPDGRMPQPPFHLVDNADTWLDQADLVFIDPVGTGFSRPEKPEDGPKYWSLKGDVHSVADFIRLYLTRNDRWTSPLFLAGESYGTTRASALSGYLMNRGIALNGVILISSIMNFQTADFAPGNDLPSELFFPSFAATAWYHKKLAPDLQALSVAELAGRARAFASGEYRDALFKGDSLSLADKRAMAEKIARFTGLKPDYVLETNLRPYPTAELLRSENRIIGRLDGRLMEIPSDRAAEVAEADPLLTMVMPPYTACFNDYARRELGFQSDETYETLNFKVNGAWKWDSDNQSVDTSTDLASAFHKNPYMKLMVANGYYDLGTPFFATEYTLNHLGLEPGERSRITLGYYEAGHMMYIDDASRARLRQDVRTFLEGALQR